MPPSSASPGSSSPARTPPAGTNGGGGGVVSCQTDPTTTANGWCYVDPSIAPASAVAAEKALLSRCPQDEQRGLRFVGTGAATPGATLFIACANP